MINNNKRNSINLVDLKTVKITELPQVNNHSLWPALIDQLNSFKIISDGCTEHFWDHGNLFWTWVV